MSEDNESVGMLVLRVFFLLLVMVLLGLLFAGGLILFYEVGSAVLW